MRALPIFFALLLSAPLIACCPTDKDTLADEMGSVATLDTIAGRIDRQPPEYYEARLGALTGGDAIETALQRARYLDQLDRQVEALRALEPLHLAELTPGQNMRLHTSEMQLGMHLWWRGGGDEYDLKKCVEIARRGSRGMPPNRVLAAILDWMANDTPADPTRMWRDMLNLRLAPNKTSSTETGQLKERGLEGAGKLLLELLRLHPCWENFDTYYALSLVHIVEGRQNLAHYVQLRMWQVLDNGGASRVPVNEPIDDLKQLCVVRQPQGKTLVPIKLVTDENKSDITRQFSARSVHAEKLRQARADYARDRIAAGWAADAKDFWGEFKAPVSDIPAPGAYSSNESVANAEAPVEATSNAPAPAAAEEKEEPAATKERDRTTTWISLVVLVGILLLGGVAKMRIDRSARRALDETPNAEPEE